MGQRIVLLFLSLCILLISVESQDWTHHEVLDKDGKVHLYWNPPDDNAGGSEITFRIELETLGCFGMGFSNDGGLSNSDVVVGWVKDGETYFQDRFTDDTGLLIVDDQQDYEVLEAFENDTFTVFEFRRKLDTCDEHDYVIDESTMRVIYAYDTVDPPDEWAVEPFYTKVPVFSKSLVLLQPRIKEDLDLSSPSLLQWDVIAPEVDISSSPELLWCKIVKTPDLSEKHHIVHITPMVQEGHEEFVYHMALYECVGGTSEEFEDLVEFKGHECYHPEMPPEMLRCQGLTIGWAVAGGDIMLPEHAGFPLTAGKYYLFEVNYANPELQSGIIDTSGLKMYYTNSLREYDAGVYVVGSSIIPRSFVPPAQDKYVVVGHSTPECVASGFPESGAKIFAVGPHARILAQERKIRHFRGNEELVPLVHDKNFDPLYQPYRYKANEIQVLKDDQITSECVYNSSQRDTVTLGGMRTSDEICVAVIMYYPAVGRHISLSGPSYANINSVLNTNVMNEMELAGVLMNYDWPNADIEEVQNVMRNSEHETQCYVGPFMENQTTSLASYPSDLIPYEPESTCNV